MNASAAESSRDPDLSQALERAFQTIRRTIGPMGGNRPEIGLPDLRYARSRRHFWVEGFWSGQLWLAFASTGDPIFRDAARRQRPYFAERLRLPETHDHDLGFLYTLSAVADYKLTGDRAARQMGLDAAAALAGRFNPAGRFIPAWNDPPNQPTRKNRGRIIIDSMENLGLLLWAASETGDPHMREIAVAHAAVSAQHLVRADGSTYHTFVFDPDDGRPLRGETHQGYGDESCWSRGQAWGIHGFASAYAYTRLPLMADTARRLADYAIQHLPPDGVPYWDYCLPADAPQHRDSSAAAITAAGLLLLADLLEGAPDAARYRRAAHMILAGLIAGYTTADAPHAEGLLRHGTADAPRGLIDVMLPYGDYFYVEALLRALGRREFFW